MLFENGIAIQHEDPLTGVVFTKWTSVLCEETLPLQIGFAGLRKKNECYSMAFSISIS